MGRENKTSKLMIVGLLAVAVVGIGISVRSIAYISGGASESDTSTEEREQLYKEATTRGASMVDYPKSERELLTKFWQAVGAADWETVTLLCPGSQREDFAMYEKWKPGPIKRFGAGEPHGQEQDVMMFPIVTSFPGFSEKTIKLAVRRTSDGRLIIDGKYTIWW